jgi:transketolase
MELPTIFVFSHDSIGVGEDGPTHQPVEHLVALRAIPGLNVIRPADANEAVEAWRVAMAQSKRPTCIILSRKSCRRSIATAMPRRTSSPAAPMCWRTRAEAIRS